MEANSKWEINVRVLAPVNKQPQRTEGKKKRFPKLQGNISIKNTQRRSRERPQPEAGVEK